MNEGSHLKKIMSIAFICAILSVLCCSDNAVDSAIGEQFTFEGIIVDQLGNTMSGINLYLINPLEMNPSKLITDSCYTTKSGKNGAYQFTGVHEGIYNFFGSDSSGQKMFITTVTIGMSEAEVINGKKVVVHDTERIKEAGTIFIDIPKINQNSFLYIPGTVIRIPIVTAGEYHIKCPSSTVDLNMCKNDSVIILFNDIYIQEGQSIDLTGYNYIVPSPKIISGKIAGVIGETYTFTAGGVSLGQNEPIQYRFDWGGVLSIWNVSNQASYAWIKPGTYPVRTQARSVKDTTSVSQWSDAVEIVIQK